MNFQSFIEEKKRKISLETAT